jgi:hypothetical protein
MNFFKSDAQLHEIVDRILTDTRQQFPTLTEDKIALTWIVYDRPVIVNTGGALSAEEFWQHRIRGYSHRGSDRVYPASIVKLFYLVAIQEWLEAGMISSSKELDRAVVDMVVDSSNDATSLVVDVLTGTTSGPELPEHPFETWKNQRNIINRYFKSLGWSELDKINVNQKTWCDGAYGREKAFLGEMYENRNMLTSNAIARLLHSIVGGVTVSSDRSQQMMRLLQRTFPPTVFPPDVEENQVTGFIGESLPENSQLWSKAGWTSQVRHDAAYVEIPERLPYLLVVLTEGQENAKNRSIIPFISAAIVREIEGFANDR